MTRSEPSGAASRPDVVVVGGGLVGLLAARALADDGLAVLLLERASAPGCEASFAAAGMLSPQMEAAEGILVAGGPDARRRRDAMLELCFAARAGYADFVRRLEAETGREVGYCTEGTLVAALEPTEAERLIAQVAAQRGRGLEAHWLEGGAARRLEPDLAPAVLGAAHLPDDHRIDNVALLEAALAALTARPRVRIRREAEVLGLEVERGAVCAVRLRDEAIPAERVVLAAGAWSDRLAALPRRIGVRPVRGQMVAVRPEGGAPGLTVGGRGVYCVPRADGRVLVGATVEDVGFDRGVEPAAIAGLRAAAAALVPRLAGAPETARWSGLRPGTPDDLPVIGPEPRAAGLVWACGHYRNGILLAPLTAAWVAALYRGAVPPVDPAPFRPERFDA